MRRLYKCLSVIKIPEGIYISVRKSSSFQCLFLSPSVIFDLLVAALNIELCSALRRCEANGISKKSNVVFLFIIVLE